MDAIDDTAIALGILLIGFVAVAARFQPAAPHVSMQQLLELLQADATTPVWHWRGDGLRGLPLLLLLLPGAPWAPCFLFLGGGVVWSGRHPT